MKFSVVVDAGLLVDRVLQPSSNQRVKLVQNLVTQPSAQVVVFDSLAGMVTRSEANLLVNA